ncbi:non-canonical poly(A) RNA polymerase PAPD5/7 [Microdochium nivale]|nr:non-canonical poly(A) RNA polymerase PAPD5/7 [Microdochium nivale]
MASYRDRDRPRDNNNNNRDRYQPPPSRRHNDRGGSDGYAPSQYAAPPPPVYPPAPGVSAPSQRSNGHHEGGGDDRSFRGGGGGYRDEPRRQQRDEFRPPQGDFTFRAPGPGGSDSYRPGQERFPPPRDYSRNNDSHGPSKRGRFDRDGRPGARGRRLPNRPHDAKRRQPWSRKASDRALLQPGLTGQHAELMLGDLSARTTYRALDELSDTDEAAMEISGEESGAESDSENADRAAKRIKTSAATDIGASEDKELPKWSNPDPYTALPPPNDESRKKVDMVQLIRKARVEAEGKKGLSEEESAEFISFDFSDDADEAPTNGNTLAPASAPKGPSAARAPHNLPPRPPSPPKYEPPPPPPPQDNDRSSSSARTRARDTVDMTPSASLGNRKRGIDDKIKMPHSTLKRVTRAPTTGKIVSDWAPRADEDSCPWAVYDHSDTPNMGVRLHKEIVDFYNYVRPREYEEDVRQLMLSKLEAVVKNKIRDAVILPFGSFKSGLYLPTADMDIAICSQKFVDGGASKLHTKGNLYALRAHLVRSQIPYKSEVELILHAKVPLAKYTDAATGLKVDISFEKMDGHNAVQTFLEWKRTYPAMPMLVAVVKQFLAMRGLNEPVNGGIGGFTIICLVVHLLNSMPQIQSGSMIAEHHLGEVLMEFFDYYGNHFQYETVAIRMNPPGLLNKADSSSVVYRNLDRLSIIDPNNPDNDISGGSSNTRTIMKNFADAAALLRKQMADLASNKKREGKSGHSRLLLEPLLGGKYSQFQVQRDWIHKLAVDGFPDPGSSHSRGR